MDQVRRRYGFDYCGKGNEALSKRWMDSIKNVKKSYTIIFLNIDE